MSSFAWPKPLIIIIISVVTVTLNAIESFLLIKRGSKRKIHESLILSLSLSDCAVGLTSFTFNLLVTFDLYNVFKTTKQNMDKIKAYALMSVWFTAYVSLFHIVGITVDRALVIRYPIRHKLWISPWKTNVFIVLSWLISIVITWVSTIGTVVSNMESQTKRFVAGFCLSIGFVLTVSYIFIVKIAIVSRKTTMSSLGINSKKRKTSRQEKHLLLLCMAIVLSFVLCMFPYSIQVFAYGSEDIVGCILLVSNSLVNPMVYFYGQYLERRTGNKDSTKTSINKA